MAMPAGPLATAVSPAGLAAAGRSGATAARTPVAAAQAFEAQALGMLLQPAFAAADVSRSSFGGGAAEAQWQPMLVEAIAGAAARAGGVGIGAMVLREMLRWQGSADGAEGGGVESGAPAQAQGGWR
jgi:peptidoglycan hydrolase FlgJ